MFSVCFNPLSHFFSIYNPRTVLYRAVNESGSGSGSGTPGKGAPNELKEVKAKLVNVQFDLKERDIRIQSLMNKLLTLQSSLDDFAPPKQGSFTETSSDHPSKLESPRDSSDSMTLKIRLGKAEEELRNAKSDVERLQAEKNEAEVAGKGFMERYVIFDFIAFVYRVFLRTYWSACTGTCGRYLFPVPLPTPSLLSLPPIHPYLSLSLPPLTPG